LQFTGETPEDGHLVVGINGWCLRNLPSWSSGPSGPPSYQLEILRSFGFNHLQVEEHDPLREAALAGGFEVAGTARADTCEEVASVVELHRSRGYVLTTLHLGTGFEDDAQACRLLEAVL
jgi:hypothetical protein